LQSERSDNESIEKLTKLFEDRKYHFDKINNRKSGKEIDWPQAMDLVLKGRNKLFIKEFSLKKKFYEVSLFPVYGSRNDILGERSFSTTSPSEKISTRSRPNSFRGFASAAHAADGHPLVHRRGL